MSGKFLLTTPKFWNLKELDKVREKRMYSNYSDWFKDLIRKDLTEKEKLAVTGHENDEKSEVEQYG